MRKAFLQLHIAVFLAGFTGIFGKLISLNEAWLVWYRLLLTTIALFLLQRWRKENTKVERPLPLLLIGGMIALHWVAFYGSIKYANVSVGLVCLSTIGFFTALIEPVLTKVKFDIINLLLGIIAITGIYLIFNFNPQYAKGIGFGLISALFATCFSVLNKQWVAKVSVRDVLRWEMLGGWLVLSCLLPIYQHWVPSGAILPSGWDGLWLAILVIICTVWAFELQLSAMRSISAFTTNLTYNLEPLYGIVFAYFLFHEKDFLQTGFFAGLALVMLAVVLQMVRVMRYRQ